MAIKISGTTVVDDSRNIDNIVGLRANGSFGTAGQVLSSNGTATYWADSTSGGTMPTVSVFTSPGTYTKPAGLVGVKVTLVGGGEAASSSTTPGGNDSIPFTTYYGGRSGAGSLKFIPAPSITGPVSVTVGVSGTPSVTGGTSSFGAFCTAAGEGGAASGGDINIQGSDYPSGVGTTAGRITGAHSAFGLGTGNSSPTGSPGFGGGGGANPNRSGQPGVVIVEEFY